MPNILASALISWKTLSLLALLLIVLSIVQTFIAWYRLRHIKGPWIASISKLWLLRHAAGSSMHLDLAEVCEKYGTLARIGPNNLVTSDPEVFRRMISVRTAYKRSEFYEVFRFFPGRENVVSERDDKKHSALRTKMAFGYSGKENEKLEDTIDRNVLAFVKLIETKYLSTGSDFRPFDFARKSNFFTLDAISDLAFGEPFGDLAANDDVHGYIKNLEEFMPTIPILSVIPWVSRILQSRLLEPLLPSDKDAIGFGKLIGLARQVASERYGPGKKVQRDMLGSFVRHGLTQEEAEAEILVQIVAGSDTTASAIRSTMLHIITNPQISAKLLEEIATASPKSPISDAEAKKLPYLQAVIKEGLRMCPPASGLLSKDVPAGGDYINGIFVPEGTSIGWSAWGIFRNKQFWGEDANLFRPERWLECSPERLREQEWRVDLVFHSGKWLCLGRGVALMELNKVFVELLRNFDLSVVDPTKAPWKSVNKGLFIQSEMWLRASRRGRRL